MSNNSNFFDINNQTESKNPILFSIFRELQNSTELGKQSVDVKELQNQHSKKYNSLYSSLTATQKDLLDEVYFDIVDEYTQSNTEFCTFGFKLGVKLMIEIFG